MGSTKRLLISAGSIIVMIIVGVFLGRVVRGTPDAPQTATSSAATDAQGQLLLESDFAGTEQITAADVVPVPQRVIVVLEPVLVSIDPAAGDDLLNVEPTATDALQIPAGGAADAPVYSGATGSFAPDDQVSRLSSEGASASSSSEPLI